MIVPVLIFICIALLAVVVALFNAFRTQRAGITGVLHLISTLAQGDFSRRTNPYIAGQGGELARAANGLAETLETRASRAQQDKDHLLSLLAVMDQSNEIALATDNMDMIRLANPAAARIFERPAEQLIGKHVESVIHHPDLLALYRHAFSVNTPVSAQIALQIPGRTVHCQATAATIYTGPHYRGTLLLMRDVTDVARTLQMKTDFVANASHELRTPLASIRAAVETIKDAGVEDSETTRRCIDIINNHALRLQMMVQDLLDLSRTEDARAVVRSDRVDLALACEMAVSLFAPVAAERHVPITIELAEDARTFRGDERLLMLMLKNLLDNATKFTHAGMVTIRSSKTEEPEQFVLEVQDTGCGIPLEDQERVFERFYTVNRSRGGADRGTGLGLSIVKHAVNAMGGHVELHSEVNKGTTIRCVFPRPAG
jgi:two-component system phosphate regulon sensor histidine kinase PhoR